MLLLKLTWSPIIAHITFFPTLSNGCLMTHLYVTGLPFSSVLFLECTDLSYPLLPSPPQSFSSYSLQWGSKILHTTSHYYNNSPCLRSEVRQWLFSLLTLGNGEIDKLYDCTAPDSGHCFHHIQKFVGVLEEDEKGCCLGPFWMLAARAGTHRNLHTWA